MSYELHAQVLRRLVEQFDATIIQNNLRGLYVEFMVAELLGASWSHNGSDWAAFDLEHFSGTRLEVKQSSNLQTWKTLTKRPLSRSLSIKVPKFEWVGAAAIPRTTRVAEIYVFAWHEDGTSSADQRVAEQWVFFVVPASTLPEQKTISISALKKLAKPVSSSELKASVEALLVGGNLQ